MYPTQKLDAKTAIASLRNDVETTPGGFDGLSYVPSQCCEKKSENFQNQSVALSL